jgi:hypothetical protein
MPVLRDVAVDIGMDEILRREGAGGRGEIKPRIMEVLREVLGEVDSSSPIEPLVAYEQYGIDAMSATGVLLQGDGEIAGSLLPTLFPDADGLVVMVCTIGPALESRSREYFKRGEQMRGFLLDGIGSAAVDVLGREACRRIMDLMSARGMTASSPVNPGMPGLPLSEQARFLELARAQRIGVSLTSGGMLVPLKSLSMVIGIGANMPQWTPEHVCARCFLRENCPHRLPTVPGSGD